MSRSVALGCGGNRRGGIGTEQQRVELGFERGEPCILELEPLRFLTRFDRVDLGIDCWMPMKRLLRRRLRLRRPAPPGRQGGEEF